MRRRRSSVVAVLVGLLLAACAGGGATDGPAEPPISPSEPFTEVRGLALEGPDGERRTLHAWVADAEPERALGLMHRTELPEGAGMLFVFDADHDGGFWMKNTRIPLSIAYVAAGGEVLAILDMEPCTADPCPVYDPGAPYRYAIEANQGWFARHGVEPGWRLLDDLSG